MGRSRSEKSRVGTAEVFPARLVLTTLGSDASFGGQYPLSIFSIAIGPFETTSSEHFVESEACSVAHPSFRGSGSLILMDSIFYRSFGCFHPAGHTLDFDLDSSYR
jgi:hypothetical protein